MEGKNLFLGYLLRNRKLTYEKFSIPWTDLLTHVFVCGSTGSGKTVLGKLIIEEAAKNRVNAVIVDLKGDLTSLAIPLIYASASEFEPWMSGLNQLEQRKGAITEAQHFRKMLRRSGITQKDLKAYRANVKHTFYTAKSKLGEQFCISLFAPPPKDIESLYNNEPETVLELANINARSILSRVFDSDEIESLNEERAFLEEVILKLWLQNKYVAGKEGIVELIRAINTPPFETIGALNVDEFLPKDRRTALSRRLNLCLVGSESLWFCGEPLEEIINRVADSKESEIAIFNLSNLTNFSESNLVVSSIAYTIYNWMRNAGGSDVPRLIFYLDEIGSGSQSYFPEQPYETTSKSAISLLLRQGRAFGISTILSTQNPGDIDYKGLTNCHTWFVGKLLTKEDREKIIQGISSFAVYLENFENTIKTCDSGEFVIKNREGKIFQFKEKWLLSLHKAMARSELSLLKEKIKEKNIWAEALNIAKTNIEKAISFLDEKSKSYNSPLFYIEQGFLFEKIKKLNSALKCFNKAVSINKNYEIAWFELGTILTKAGKFQEALKAYNNVLTIDSENIDALIQKAKILIMAKMYKEAEDIVEKVLRLEPDFSVGYSVFSDIKFKTGEFTQALEFIEKAIELAPASSEFYLKKGIICKELNSNFIAMEAFDKAYELNKSDITPLYYKAELKLAISEVDGALNDLKEILKIKPDYFEAALKLAMCYFEKGDFKAALKEFDRLIKEKPEVSRTYVQKGLCLMKLEKNDEALVCFEKAKSLGLEAPEYYFIKAEKVRETGKIDSALALYQKAIALNPEYVEALYKLAKLYETQNDITSAIETYEKLHKIQPENIEFIRSKGDLFVKSNEIDKAIQLYEQVVNQGGADFELYIKLASLYSNVSEYELAIECYDYARTIKPAFKEAWKEKGKLFIKLKKYEEALYCFDQYFGREPEVKEGWELMAEAFKGLGEFSKENYCREQAKKFD